MEKSFEKQMKSNWSQGKKQDKALEKLKPKEQEAIADNMMTKC